MEAMMGKNDDLIKPKGKGKKALNRLNAINKEINSISEQLKNIRQTLNDIFNGKENFEKIDGMLLKPLELNADKKRSMVKSVPKRIEFEFRNLSFYIDFTVVGSTGENPIDLNGGIIYGATKTLCFTECIFPVNSNKDNDNDKNNSANIENKKCKNCEIITRCDRLEGKPLLQFTVNRTGLIKASGEIDDEWWIKEKRNEDLFDLHIRAVDHIWGKALEWTNEKLLP